MKDRTFTALDAVGSKLATIPEKSGRGSDSASSSKPSASGSSGRDGSADGGGGGGGGGASQKERLRKLKEWLDDDLINKAEFDAKKKEILDAL